MGYISAETQLQLLAIINEQLNIILTIYYN